MPIIPDGTRFVLPPEWEWRESLKHNIQEVFSTWGYQAVQTPALEIHDPSHPLSDRAFKLVDRDGMVLALRSEYTTAVGKLIRTDLSSQPFPIRLQYAGSLWLRSMSSELGRMREFTQVGAELVGVSSPRADAELIMMALDALNRLGVRHELELGHPGFVHSVLEETGLPEDSLNVLHNIIDRKATPELRSELEKQGIRGSLEDRILCLPDLYGGIEILDEALELARNDTAREAVEHVREVVNLTGREDHLLDLGMSRRYSYYTGLTFRAYTPDFGLPLLGGGRYDSGIPGAGFAIGLERVMAALGNPPGRTEPQALALDFASAEQARQDGYRTEFFLDTTLEAALLYAKERGIGLVYSSEGVTQVE
ncbi:ATP phosphoribosyltransferase regulatory subunit [Deinococcus roseus]|uniref:ATP phosphoribosyltransferase regulatory subunit n=1 Tax=Deinococcus roseus TaxID=392414 RepID=A0ABQ2D113_9DEIO|nr:ATP phosphoribosyltransferase regulatory subunit [Deinococcus roseus]GGJ40770.1 ATP phosphoribosyltransferase regulatory subunit [Deinococcus roseus]